MRIGFIHYSYPGIGGTETVTNLLGRYFTSQGHVVTVLAWKAPVNEICSEFEVVYLPDKASFNSSVNDEFITEYAGKNLDCVINQGPFWTPASELKQSRCCVMSVLHYSPYFKIASQRNSIEALYHGKSPSLIHWLKSGIRYRFRNYFAKRDFRRLYRDELNAQIENSDRFVVLCKDYISELNDVTERTHANVVAIPNGLAPVEQRTSDPKRKHVVYIGRLSRWDKRVDRLLNIWKTIETRNPDWKLFILGDGPERDNLCSLAENLNLRNCSFKGFVDVKPYLEKASILAMTSSSEGFPMVILEAQGHGVVPVAYNVSSGIAHIIKDGMNGILVKPFDSGDFIEALDKLISDTGFRKRLSDNALSSISDYSVERMGEKYLSVIKNELKNKRDEY